MPQHFLFVSVPAHGHVNPTLPVVEELVRRGHRVTYATNEKFGEVLRAAGADVLATPSDMPSPPPTTDFTPERMAEMNERMLENARCDMPEVLSRMQADPPDAVCYDAMTFIGRLLANQLDVPGIPLNPSFASNEHFSLREEFMPGGFDLEHPVLQEPFRKMQEFAAEYGVQQDHPMMMEPEAMNIVFVPREFQLAAESFVDDERFRFVGPAFGPRGEQEWQPADDTKPLLFISLGTAFNNRIDFYRTCLEAFGDSGWHVAMSIGEQIDPAELGEIPANFEVRPQFPQPAVLQHSAVFLSHAGMNSTMESLYSGVPLVTVPQMPEQEANATRAEELGLGQRLDTAAVTAELLRSSVDEVNADEQVRENLAKMREIVRNAGGPVAAADALEAHLA